MIDIINFSQNDEKFKELESAKQTNEEKLDHLKEISRSLLKEMQNINQINLIRFAYAEYIKWVYSDPVDSSQAPLLYICEMCLNYPLINNQNSPEEIYGIYQKLLHHYALSHLIFVQFQDNSIYGKYMTQCNSRDLRGLHGYEKYIKEFISQVFQKQHSVKFLKKKNYEPSDLCTLIESKRKSHKKWLEHQKGTYEELTALISSELFYENTPLVTDLSCTFGCNNNTYLLPSDKGSLTDKPFISLGCKALSPIICYNGYRHAALIWDKWLTQEEPKYLSNSGSKSRGVWLEKKTYDLCVKFFGKENCYLNKYFEISENGITKRVELDILVVYGSYLLYFECKSNKVNKSRDTSVKYHDTLNKDSFLGKAGPQIRRFYKECKKSKLHIYDSDTPSDSTHKTIQWCGESFLFIPCIVTWESFEYLAGDSKQLMAELKSWNSLGVQPMIFQIFDLVMIADILDKDYLFVDYLLQKLFMNKDSKEDHILFYSGNEMDQLAVYVQRGQIPYIKWYNYTDPNRRVMTDPSNEKIFEKYLASHAEKPQRKHDPYMENLLECIDTFTFQESDKKTLKQWVLAQYNCLHNLDQQFSIEKIVNNLKDPKSLVYYFFPNEDNKRAILTISLMTEEMVKSTGEIISSIKDNPSPPLFTFILYDFHKKKFQIRSCTPMHRPYDILLPSIVPTN